jgi:hypothetical protein
LLCWRQSWASSTKPAKDFSKIPVGQVPQKHSVIVIGFHLGFVFLHRARGFLLICLAPHLRHPGCSIVRQDFKSGIIFDPVIAFVVASDEKETNLPFPHDCYQAVSPDKVELDAIGYACFTIPGESSYMLWTANTFKGLIDYLASMFGSL